MGKMLVILLVALGSILGIIGLNMNRSGSAMSSNTGDQVTLLQAKRNAVSGVDLATGYLSADTNWTGVSNKQLMRGTVTITAQNTAARYFNGPNANLSRTRLIISIGSYNGVKDTVRCVLGLPKGFVLNIPKFLRYSVISDANVSIGGNIYMRDDNNPLWNANVHTNGTFSLNGGNTVKGFLTYVTGINGLTSKYNATFIPNSNPDNLPAYYKSTAVSIPTFDPSAYSSIATKVYNSSTSITGNVTLGSKDNPAIIYVNGDLSIAGNFTGYGVFLVKGAVTCTGNFSLTSVDPLSNNLGIYAGGNVSIQGGTVRAQLFTNANVNISSNSQVYGGITAKGTISFQGGANFYYRPINESLTNPFWPSDPDAGVASKIYSFYGN